MTVLRVNLFGSVRLYSRKVEVSLTSEFPKQPFTFLALHAGKAFTRHDLANALWPDASEARARGALNTALWRMRQVPSVAERIAAPTRDTVTFAPGFGTWIDAAAFVRHTERAAAMAQDRPGAARRLLRRSLAHFDTGLAIDTQEEWALIERTRLENRWLDALGLAAKLAFDACDYTEAEHLAAQVVERENFREEAHAIRIQSVALGGDRLRAQHLFGEFSAMLMRELGVAPAFSIDDLEMAERKSGAVLRVRPPSSGDTTMLRTRLKGLRFSLDRFEAALNASGPSHVPEPF